MRTPYALALAFALVVGVGTASAQTPVPSPTPPTTLLGWDHDGVNTDGYKLSVDGVSSVVAATCTGTAPARTCTIPFPALTPGLHSLIVIAFNQAGEASSEIFRVTVFVQPAPATNIRIIQIIQK